MLIDDRRTVAMLASDQDREQCTTFLGEQYAAGRLDLDSFRSRVELAVAATTLSELEALTDDLPVGRPGRRISPTERAAPLSAVRKAVIASVAVFGIAAVLGIGQLTSPGPTPEGICAYTGLTPGDTGTCPTSTKAMDRLIATVDRTHAAADQVELASDGASDGSRLQALEDVVDRAAREADDALTTARTAIATGAPDRKATVRDASRQADAAFDRAARAAIEADQEPSG